MGEQLGEQLGSEQLGGEQMAERMGEQMGEPRDLHLSVAEVQSGLNQASLANSDVMTMRLLHAHDFPWKHGFTSMLRGLSAHYGSSMVVIGKALRPQDEPFRLGQHPTLSFAPREIAAVTMTFSRPKITLFSLGMLGTNGPLPLHFTEIAKDRMDNRHDATLINFLDIFHHRAMTLQYRAWAQSQAAAGLDRPDEAGFAAYISRLIGIEPHDPVSTRLSAVSGVSADTVLPALPVHARLQAAAHLIRQSRNSDSVTSTLAHFFGIPVRISEFFLHWIVIAPEDRTRLGRHSGPVNSALLGVDALLGSMLPDKQHKFRLYLGPLTLEQYVRFTPKGKDLPLLIDWIRAFIGIEYEWDVELSLKPHEVPVARLGGGHQLGWSAWLSGDFNELQNERRNAEPNSGSNSGPNSEPNSEPNSGPNSGSNSEPNSRSATSPDLHPSEQLSVTGMIFDPETSYRRFAPKPDDAIR